MCVCDIYIYTYLYIYIYILNMDSGNSVLVVWIGGSEFEPLVLVGKMGS